MSIEQTLSALKNGQPDPKWIIFKYHKTRAFLMLLYKIFFAGFLLGIVGLIFFYSAKPLTSDVKVIVYGLGSVGVIGLLVLLHHIYTMFFLNSNVIVLTENEVIKSIRGKVFAWAYADISNLQQIITQTKNSMPTYSVEFKDQKSGRVLELARGYEFGPSQDIFEILKTKVQ